MARRPVEPQSVIARAQAFLDRLEFLHTQERGFSMKVGTYAPLFAVACIAATALPASAEEGQPPAPHAGTDVSRNAPGMKAFVDPQTGVLTREPAPGAAPLELSPAERNAFSTSHEGVVEVPSTVPGGGFKLDLQGRFQSPLTATVGPDGKVTTQHHHADGPSDGKK
jgi:hypothetical protein